ncbi:metallophosphoesterase family protein [Fulvivirgaceae bacterium BMA12]|uniref:Metallophosphoesterase family protein n=1 Tax=Agaribacillus aureus TaxID=3051825 RepID=A0ABT8L6W2_9BACT|nr:metallophosphoesterase family protein [Fulvivirgaceae bacterium BMA12]
MKTKSFKIIVRLVSVTMPMILLVLLLQRCQTIPETFALSDKYRLVWRDDPTTNLTIAWDQHEDVNPVVMYGLRDHGRAFWKYKHSQKAERVLEKYEMNTHFASLTDLKPDKAYYFVIKDDNGVSERYWFRTAPDKPKPFTFVAGGDTKSDDEPLEAGRASNRLVSKLRPLFVMFNGDFCSGNGTDAKRWHTWLKDWQELTTTEDGRMIPVFPVHGNHENGDHANLNYIFNAPYQDNDSSRIYFSLSFGGDFFHMISLNSEIDEGGAQRDWLKNDLRTHKDFRMKIAGYHKPFWPHTARKAENEYQFNQWAYLFYDYGLDVALDGDSHMSKITYPLRPDSTSADSFMGFVRDDENGTMFLGEGSWGAFPRVNDDDKPWTLHSFSGNQIKWIHVLPAEKALPDRMSIYTVVSATYDEDEKQTLYHSEVESLQEDNLFKIPANITLVKNRQYGEEIKYPMNLNGVATGTE